METPEATSLPTPTVELVLAEGKRFDESQILLKVAAIHQLYSTNIYAVRWASHATTFGSTDHSSTQWISSGIASISTR